jgi:amino acid transporter
VILAGILIGTVIISATVYMALNKKSDFATRLASLIALGVMLLTIVICVFMVFTDNSVPVDESVLIVGAPVEVAEKKDDNTMELILLTIFLIGIFSVLVFLAMRENRKQNQNTAGSKQEIPKTFNF